MDMASIFIFSLHFFLWCSKNYIKLNKKYALPPHMVIDVDAFSSVYSVTPSHV